MVDPCGAVFDAMFMAAQIKHMRNVSGDGDVAVTV